MASEKFDKKEGISGFKLLSIRPLQGCSSRFRKNLKEGMVYKFYQNYDYYINNDGTEEILTNENFKSFVGKPIYRIDHLGNEVDLYSKDDLKINISAIVGENGSGKSSLIELLYVAVYLCSFRKILSHMIQNEDDKELPFDQSHTINKILEIYSTAKKNKNAGNKFYEGYQIFVEHPIHLELYYQNENSIYQLTIDSKNLDRKELYQLKIIYGDSDKELDLPIPFYNIALNYSIHSLNCEDMGKWIDSIFHKNDAYQTPLVINPKRTSGDIEVENEKLLQKSRMLSNTMEIESYRADLKPLFNNKTINRINLKLTSPSVYSRQSNISFHQLNSYNVNVASHLLDSDFIDRCDEYQSKLDINKKFKECSWIEQEAYAYLSYKIPKILDNYKQIFKNGKLEDLKEYDSHITFKLWQTINFINYSNPIKTHFTKKVKLSIGETDEENNPNYYTIEKEDLLHAVSHENLNNLFSKQPSNVYNQINYLPPPIFEYDIQFSEDPNDTFNQLSSGEKQQIYSIHTIMYHLRNVASVNRDEEKNIIKFRDINILLDEVELYFHPELQRKFVKRLLDSIKVLSDRLKDNIDSINILFATHSPFILSDIPSSKVLRLKDGNPVLIKDETNTFGANIHNLLANDFFLKDGFIGEFANKKINEIITFLNHEELDKTIEELDGEKDKNEISDLKARKKQLDKKSNDINIDNCYEIILLIGEPVIKEALLRQYYDIIKTDYITASKFFKRLANDLNYEILKKK